MPRVNVAKMQFQLPHPKLPKIIGVMDHVLYALILTNNRVEIWTMNVFLPDSWQQRWKFEFADLSYFTATVQPNEGCLYCLFTGCYIGGPYLELEIWRLGADDETYTRYTSSDATSIFELADLYNLHFETDTLCNGETDLFVYDRGIVRGVIPFTRFVLDHKTRTYSGRSEPIPPDDPRIKPTVFGALMDPDRKRFIKLTDENKLCVFTPDSNQWLQYEQTERSDLQLKDILLRHLGIGISYDQDHTRFAMVSSPINLLGGDGVCLLTYKRYGRVVFYRVQFNQNQTFSLQQVACINHPLTQAYMQVDRRQLIILSKVKPSYIIQIGPMTLKEIAFKCAQVIVGRAKDDSAIRRICEIRHEGSLI